MCGALAANTTHAGSQVITFPQADGSQWTVTITPQAGAADGLVPLAAPAASGVAMTPAPPADGPAKAPTPPPDDAPAVEQAPPATLLPLVGPAVPVGESLVTAHRYAAVYRSIPFSYAEYLANPSYRHEATMEILFGHLRATVVHKNQPSRPVVRVAPAGFGSPLSLLRQSPGLYPLYPHWPAGSTLPMNSYYDYSRGQYTLSRSLFGYEGGWRPMFYNNSGYGSPFSPFY